MKRLVQSVVGFLGLFALSLSAWAGDVSFKTEVFKEVVQTVDGVSKKVLQAAEKVLPGEEVIYILSFENIGNTDVQNISLKNPIPNNTVYQANSAFGTGTIISVSVDGGKRFDELQNLSVTAADGGQRPATHKDVTDVRWDVEYSLAPGQTGTVSYRAVVQ